MDEPISHVARIIGDKALPYCMGNGLDLGYGGKRITKSAISVDLPTCPFDDVNYRGDASDLPFKDGVMDYVFSSHLLEDFENTTVVLMEWCRVLKVGGYLILYLPIEKIYLEVCKEKNLIPNAGHKVDMSAEYLMLCIGDLPLKVVDLIERHEDYSFFVVFRKWANGKFTGTD